jgi:hypothetical protein
MCKKKNQRDVHHRKPTSIGGTNEDRNLSSVRKSHHEHWHGIFGNKTAQQICDYINDVWLDPDYKFKLTKVVRTPKQKPVLQTLPKAEIAPENVLGTESLCTGCNKMCYLQTCSLEKCEN